MRNFQLNKRAVCLLLLALLGVGCAKGTAATPAKQTPVRSAAAKDPAGDVHPPPKPTSSEQEESQPLGTDLTAVSLHLMEEFFCVEFEARDNLNEALKEGADIFGTPVWSLRLWPLASLTRDPSYTLIVGAEPREEARALNVIFCEGNEFCGNRVTGASATVSEQVLVVKLPRTAVKEVGDAFKWFASASGNRTPNIDNAWNDWVPDEALDYDGLPDPSRSESFPNNTERSSLCNLEPE